MKLFTYRFTLCFTGIYVAARLCLTAQAAEITPKPVLDIMQRVADWQMANPSTHRTTEWTQAAGYAGFMALAGLAGDAKYRDAMFTMGESNQWQLGPRKFHADDHAVGQAYCELYFLYRDPRMIAPLREKFDSILAQPSEAASLDFKLPKGKSRELWAWCDALFMAPPAWARLSYATGDQRYLDFAVKEWWRTSDYLYDTNEHLFFRDSTYFNKLEANGKKVFWGRGNGWVMGGLVRLLQYLPMNHPDRPRFEQQFKEMAEKILMCQQPDGLWRASLLDPESYPLKETSGSGFFTYGMAWGVNQGLLDPAKFEPAVRKAWTALVECVDADGKLTHVQPIGANPKSFTEDSTEVYGVGAFLLAGNEVYRMAVMKNAHASIIKVANPTNVWRKNETAEFRPPHTLKNLAVLDGVSSRILTSQLNATASASPSPDTWLFQVDLAPGEARTFYVLDAAALVTLPPPMAKTFARDVPEHRDQPLHVTMEK